MKKIFTALILLASLTSFAADEIKGGQEITVGVNGMVCAFCAQGIEKKFKEQKEVMHIEVSLEKKYIKLHFKEGQSLSNDQISSILKASGYEAVFKK